MAKEKDPNRLSKFSKTYDGMIANDVSSYNSISSSNRATLPTQYTKEQINQILLDGNPTDLKELSRTFFYVSGFYKMLILYYANFLDYSVLTVPKMAKEKDISTQIKNSYNEALAFQDNLKIKNLFARFALKVYVDGAYYGILTKTVDGLTNIIDLPYDYCRSRFKNYQGIDIVEFNLAYFDTIFNAQKRTDCLKSYPDEIRIAYNAFKNKRATQWFLVPPEQGIHFAFFEERPLFSDIIPAVMDFADYRELEKEKDQQDLYKILIQEMPHLNDGELVFDPEEVEVMHAGISQMIKQKKGIDFVTSFGSMKVADMQANRSVISNNLEKISNSIYTEAGVSREIFTADHSTTLNQSLKKDMSIAMHLGQKFVHWLEFVVNEKFGGKNNLTFSLTLLPLTFYNRDEIFKNSFQGVQNGYSFILPFIALGIKQSDIRDLKILENKILELDKVMKPLMSAAQMSSQQNQQAKTVEQGRQDAKNQGKTLDNKKTQEERAEQTIKNRESGGMNE